MRGVRYSAAGSRFNPVSVFILSPLEPLDAVGMRLPAAGSWAVGTALGLLGVRGGDEIQAAVAGFRRRTWRDPADGSSGGS